MRAIYMTFWFIIHSACQSLPKDIRATAHLHRNHPHLQCNAVPIPLCCSFSSVASISVLAKACGANGIPFYCLSCLLLLPVVFWPDPAWKRVSHCSSSSAVGLSSFSSIAASFCLCFLDFLLSIASTSDLAESCKSPQMK